jgi:protein SCO1/2
MAGRWPGGHSPSHPITAILDPEVKLDMAKYGIVLIGVVIGLALTLAAGWLYLDQNYTYKGALIDPPAPAADFVLNDQHGEPFRLSDQRGKVVLIFFGYTHCPDVCPVTLSEYKQIKASLGEKADQVRFVFISVDPERDTRQRVGDYVANFDPGITGLTGERLALEPVWKSYGVYAARQELGSAAGYLVDHSARMYLIDPQGNWRLNYAFGMDANGIVQDILHLLRQG